MEAAITQASDAVMITDVKGNIQYCNPAFERMTGYTMDEVSGRNVSSLKSGMHDDSFYQDLWQTISSGRVWKGEFVNKRKDGTLFAENATISPVKNSKGQITNYVALKHDVSKELELEKQLRQAVKMEAVGTLAAGIAHDFNNILGAIIGYTRMAMDGLSPQSQPRRDLEQALAAGDRAVDLVRQILLFSRQEEAGFAPVQLRSLLKEFCKMLRASLPATIALEMKIDEHCPPVLADYSQIHQVVMNLAANASRAMRGKGGTLKVSLEEADFDAIHRAMPEGATADRYLVLSIGDTGIGMEEEELSRIFDPFYTTQTMGEGTGLGLAIVHGIVKNHKGRVRVRSEKIKGSVFTVYLPVASEIAAKATKNDECIPRGLGEHVLVVDDEEGLLRLRERLLKGLGYRITVCSDGRQALDIFSDSPDQYDLLLTDMTMPKMGGRELAAAVMALRPDFPIILCSGYHDQIDGDEARSLGMRAFLLKPIKPAVLAQAIQKVLHGADSGC